MFGKKIMKEKCYDLDLLTIFLVNELMCNYFLALHVFNKWKGISYELYNVQLNYLMIHTKYPHSANL